MIAIAMINRKGSVGKTTLTLALADFLNAVHGFRVLVIDMDSQANASLTLLGEKRWVKCDQDNKTVADIFAEVKRTGSIPDAFGKALVISGIERVKGVAGTLSLIPCTPRLQQIEEELMEGDPAWRYVMGSPYFVLHAALSKDVFPAFDFVLLDCPPALGVATLNALTAANGYIMPTIADHVSTIGVSQLDVRIRDHSKGIRREIKRYGTVVNRFKSATILHRTILAEMRAKPEFQPVWDTIVPDTVTAEEAYAKHEEILTLRGRYGQESHIYFQALGQLAEEFIRRVS
jgi:chromosome partitioning protein